MPLVGIQSRNRASPRAESIDQSSFGAPGLDHFADVLKGQVERRLTKLVDELPGVCFVARSRQLVMNGQAHIVLLALWCNAPVSPSPTKWRWRRRRRPVGDVLDGTG
jgi:hypothetical protein